MSLVSHVSPRPPLTYGAPSRRYRDARAYGGVDYGHDNDYIFPPSPSTSGPASKQVPTLTRLGLEGPAGEVLTAGFHLAAVFALPLFW